MSRWVAFGLVALAAVVVVGCGFGRSASGLTVHGSSATRAADLEGRELVAIAATGQHLLVGSTMTLDFRGGRFSASGGCNATDGAFSVTGSRLRVPREQMWTLIGCRLPVERQDSWLRDLLAVGPLVRIGEGGRTVVLSTDQETLTLARPTPAPAGLEGRKWKLVSVLEPDGRRRSLRTSAAPATFEIGGGYATFDGGCGPSGMLARIVPGGVQFGGLLRPAHHCSGHRAHVDQAIRNTLSGTTKLTYRGRSMTITRAAGALEFKAR